tara:strand:- start:42 stop:194 length:153 start_codon:yes stop_codon:yes gene_type:complete
MDNAVESTISILVIQELRFKDHPSLDIQNDFNKLCNSSLKRVDIEALDFK